MSLSNNKYKEFYFGSLISEIYKAKAINKNDLEVANNKSTSICYITRTWENNWCEMFADISWINKEYIEKWNAITIWDTTATCFYQEKQFIAWDHMVVIRSDWLNKYTWLYIVTLLNKEQYKYSYGRAFVKDKIKNTVLKLPIDDLWNPDREFMEDYIKSLHYKPITTKNSPLKHKLETDYWKEFKITSLFTIERGNITSLNYIEKWDVPIVSASWENEWISFYSNIEPKHSNKITVSMNWVNTWFASYHWYGFNINVDACVLKEKFKMNKYVWIFLATVINSLRYRYSYWRKMSVERLQQEVIKLPVDSSWNPNREFMEDYIKNLPYWDRI